MCSISNFQTSTLHFKNKKQKEVLRISFHYYNKFSEIDYLVECLIDLIKNKLDYKIMDIKKIIRLIQVTAVLLIFLGSVIGFLVEIAYMIEIRKVELADLLLLSIYVEVMGMIRVYLLQEEIRITYPLIIAITAISRLIILQKKQA